MTWLHLYKGLVLVLDNLSLQGTVPVMAVLSQVLSYSQHILLCWG